MSIFPSVLRTEKTFLKKNNKIRQVRRRGGPAADMPLQGEREVEQQGDRPAGGAVWVLPHVVEVRGEVLEGLHEDG